MLNANGERSDTLSHALSLQPMGRLIGPWVTLSLPPRGALPFVLELPPLLPPPTYSPLPTQNTMNRLQLHSDDEREDLFAVRHHPSWASFTSQDTYSTDNSPFGSHRTISPASSFTSDDERFNIKRTSSRLPSPLKRTVSLPLAPPPPKPTPASTPTPRRRSVPVLKTLLISILAVILASYTFHILFTPSLPPPPNCLLTAHLLATHAEIARDVALDVKLLRGKANRDDFHEAECVASTPLSEYH